MSIMAKGQKFKVKLTQERIGGEDGKRSFLGITSEGDNTIVIDGTIPKTRQEEVLLHELMHICDMTLPEFMVNIMSTNLYGILRENGLMAANIVGKVMDGEMSAAEMEKINKASEEMAEGEPMLMRAE